MAAVRRRLPVTEAILVELAYSSGKERAEETGWLRT